MGRCSRMLQMWAFPRLPFAINALLVQSTAGKEAQVRENVVAVHESAFS